MLVGVLVGVMVDWRSIDGVGVAVTSGVGVVDRVVVGEFVGVTDKVGVGEIVIVGVGVTDGV